MLGVCGEENLDGVLVTLLEAEIGPRVDDALAMIAGVAAFVRLIPRGVAVPVLEALARGTTLAEEPRRVELGLTSELAERVGGGTPNDEVAERESVA